MKEGRVNIANLFLEAASEYPKNLAIVEKNGKIDFGSLKNEVLQTAAYFSAKGVQKGDRVLVFVPMSIDLYRIVLALFHIGAAAVFLDEWVSKERLLLCCKLADCKAFIGTPKARVYGFFAKEIRNIPIKLNWKKKIDRLSPGVLLEPDDTALITFTTGSTGIPKAADRSHAFLKSQFDILKVKLGTRPSDVDMPVLPIVLFVNLGVGSTSVIAEYNSRKPASFDASKVIHQIEKHQVNRITASPFVVKKIAESLLQDNKTLDKLRQVFTGGAPVFPSEAALYKNAYTSSEVKIIYGSTEAEPISGISVDELLENKELLESGLPVGRVHPETELAIIAIRNTNIGTLELNEFDDIGLAENSIGEIVVAGEHVLKRYYNNPEAFNENKIVVEGKIWHRTGDSGFLNNDQLFLTGRCKQLIRKDDQIISPFIVENLLQEIDGITMGTVVSHLDKVVLVVESDRSIDVVKGMLSNLQYDELRVVSEIPRDPRHFSKIDYPKLVSQL